ncbi:TPA: class C sortase [Streptococcus pneumoniae]|nr:class C sortase [Streptococcus pneumoniae]
MVKTKKQKRNNLLLGVVFFIGMAVMAYPLVSRLYYRVESNQQIADFDKEKATLDEADIDERMKLAQAFNDSLNNVVSGDPWSEEMKKKGRAEYARMLEIHERMGHVEIPVIDVDLPVYAGTAEEVLQQGAGHLEGTSLPIGGNSTHAVITAHTGLPTAKMFTDLTKLKVGDKFYVHNIKEVMAYQVDQIVTVEPNDFEPVLIQHGEDYATLLTCTPYMINSHRLLVRGKRIPYTAPIAERNRAVRERGQFWLWLLLGAMAVILLLLYRVYRNRRIVKGLEKQLEGRHVKD